MFGVGRERVLKIWNRRKQGQNSGFTLIELLVASLIITVVMLVAWSGLISLTSMSTIAEARTLRQQEVSRALDFITHEVRTARSINATATHQVDGTTTIADLLTADGFNLNNLGSYGNLALYLEIPGTQTPPSICPANGPNAGLAPPNPSSFDRVIYDVRESSSEWLSPNTLMRYGRLKDVDGSFNPCESPISSDPMADALSDDVGNVPPCTGTLTGGAGFFACRTGEDHTSLIFQHTLVDSSVENVAGAAMPRVKSIQPIQLANVGCQHEGSLQALNDNNRQGLKIINQSPDTKRLYWLNYAGVRGPFLDKAGTTVNFISIAGNASVEQPTFLTHPWMITDDSEQCLGIFMPEESDTDNLILVK